MPPPDLHIYKGLLNTSLLFVPDMLVMHLNTQRRSDLMLFFQPQSHFQEGGAGNIDEVREYSDDGQKLVGMLL